MDFNSLFKTPLFFGLCLGSLLAVAESGIESISGVLIIFVLSALYTAYLKRYLTPKFKILAMLSTAIPNFIYRTIYPLPDAEHYFGAEATAKLKEALLQILNVCGDAFGKNAVLVGFLTLFVFVLIAIYFVEYLMITLGNKFGLALIEQEKK